MLANSIQSNNSHALNTRAQTYLNDVQRYVSFRLRDHLGKRNQNGAHYTPFTRGTICALSAGSPTALFIVFDPERLWHFQPKRLMETRFVQSVSAALQRPVVAYEHTQGVDDPIPTGITFCVLLRNDLTPASAQITAALPRVAKLDLATLNGSHKNKLLMPIGVGRDGPMWKHLNTVQHVLYVGTTGSGKTSAMQSTLAALLTQNDPSLVQTALIDTARSEFVFWHRAPHIFDKVAYSVDDAYDLLRKVEQEVARRGDLLGAAMRRSIESFNADAPHGKRLPYLLVVVDECLDLVQPGRGGNMVNELIKRVATIGRKAGVFLHAGTQYPSAAEGLSRIISTNLRTFAFRMDPVGARTVGCSAASAISEKNPGRMFARFDDRALELQAFYLNDSELEAIARQAGFVASAKQGDEPAAPKRDEVAELIKWSVESNGGVLTQNSIGAMLSQWRGSAVAEREARRIAETLEAKGLLAKDVRQNNRRCVTDNARAEYGLTAFDASAAVPTEQKDASNDGGAGGEYPANLLDVLDAEFLARIQPRLDELTACGLSAQAAYEGIVADLGV